MRRIGDLQNRFVEGGTPPADGGGRVPGGGMQGGAMRARRLVEAATGRVSVPEVSEAVTFRQRLVGLMGRTPLPVTDAVFFPNCASIHTCGMRFSLDVVFFDRGMRICRIARGVRPWRMRMTEGACHVLEMTAGAADRAGLCVGRVYRLEDAGLDPAAEAS